MTQQDPLERLKARKRASDPLERLKARRAAPRESLNLDVRQRGESTVALPFNRPNPSGDIEALEGAARGAVDWAKEGAGPTAALALSAVQAVPGVEGFEALAGMAGSQFTDRPLSFSESRDALRSQTEKIPREVRAALQFVAGGAATKLPGIAKLSPAKAGAAFGAADQALDADSKSLEERVRGTIIGGAGGVVAGKALDALITGGRAVAASSPGANAMTRAKAMRAADAKNYGAAAAEGAAATNITPVSTALALPDIEPFAKIVRQSRKFAGASDPEVLMETYKLMSKQQGGLARQLKEQGFDAAKQLQHDNLALAKEELLNAADAAGMTSLRKAVQAHAKAAGDIDAIDLGARATNRIVGAPATGPRSLEAMEERIKALPAERRAAAIEGSLGRLGERIRPNANPISGFGAFAALHRPARVASVLRRVGDPKQATLDQIIRGGAIGATTLEELLRGQ